MAAALPIPRLRVVRTEWSRWALLGALAVLPLYPKVGVASVEGTYIPLRIDDLVIAAVVALWVGGLVAARRSPALPAPWRPAAAWLACGLVALAIGGVALGTVGLGRGFLFWAKPLEYLLLGWIAYDLGRERDLVRPALAVGGATAIGVIAIGLAQSAGADPPAYRPQSLAGVVTSTMGDPHELAMYLGIVMLVAVGVWAGLDRTGRAVAGAVLAGGAIVLAGTGGRSEFVAVSVLIAAALPPRRTRVPAALALAALGLGLAVSASHDPAPAPLTASGHQARMGAVGHRLSTPLSQDLSLDQRFEQKWPRLRDRAMRDPVFGTGPSAASEGADGYYIRSFVEVGIVGSVIFAWLVLAVALSLARAARGAGRLGSGLAFGLLGATALLAVTGVLLDSWVASRPMQLFWPLVGACLAGAAVSRSSGRSSAAARRATAP